MRRKTLLIALAAATLSLSCTEGEQRKSEAKNVARQFLESLYVCNFQDAMKICTKEGEKEVLWFASNLTEDDIRLITSQPEIEIEDCETYDSVTIVTYHASNVIVCDTLEKKGYIGSRSATIHLKQEEKRWKVDRLAW